MRLIKYLKFALFTTIFLFPVLCFGQIVNVQGLLLKDYKDGLTFNLNGGGDYRSGNLEYRKFSGSFSSRYISGKSNLIFSANIDYAEKSESKFLHKYFEHLRYRFNAFKHLGFETFVQHEYNEFKRLSLRGLFGLGLTFPIFKSKKIYFIFASTYLFERNDFSEDSAYADSGEVHIYHRSNNYLSFFYKLSENFEFLETIYYQPCFNDFSDYRFLTSTAIWLKINKYLHMKISHNYSYQSNPPMGLEKYDNQFLIGLKVTLGPYLKNETKLKTIEKTK
jgi:uncharacterized protein DUF481